MKHKKYSKNDNEEVSYWSSYSDMMAALLLIFILIISFTILQSKYQYEEKEKELNTKQEQLDSLISQNVEKESELQNNEETIAQQQSELDTLIAENEAQKEQLEVMIAQNSEKESELQNYEEIMLQQQAELDRLVGVRTDLIEELMNEFADSELGVQIDEQTGAITFDSSILFDVNEFQLKETGQEFLVEFLPRYLNILMSEEFKDYISEIIIEGHTDTQGTYLFNLELSQKRALAVASFCLSDDGNVALNDIDYLRAIITASGKSFSNPVYSNDGTVDMEKSRRVEFKFRLKDDEMIDEMREILSDQ